MRRIAERLGIRAPSLYKHFPDKAALEAAIISAAFEEQAEAFERAVEGSAEPLADIAAAYRRFARAHPHLYRLMTDQELRRDLLAPGVEERAGTHRLRGRGQGSRPRPRRLGVRARHGAARAHESLPAGRRHRRGLARGDRGLRRQAVGATQGPRDERVFPAWLSAGTRSWSARARTAWRLRSCSRARVAPCSCSRPRRRSAAGRGRAELTLPGFRHDVCSAIHPLAARLAVPALAAAGRARARVRPSRDPARPPARRRQRGRAPPLGGRDGRRARQRRGRLPRADGAARGRVGAARRRPARPPAAAAQRARTSVRFARRRTALGDGARARALRRRSRASAAGGQRGALDAPAHAARDGGLRADADDARPRPSAGRLPSAAPRRSPTRWPRCCARWAARSARTARCARSAELRGVRAVLLRPDAAPDRSPIAGDELPARYRRVTRPLSLRPRGLQARLRARAAGALDGTGVPARRDDPPRRDVRGHRPGRGRGRARPACRRGPSCSSHSRACSIRAARLSGAHTLWAYCHVPNGSAVDLHETIERQIERFAPGLPRPHPRPQRHGPRRPGGLQRELRRRRHQRRRGRPAPAASRVRSRGASRTPRPTRASSSARRRRRPAAACTRCAAGTPRGRRCAARSAETLRPRTGRSAARRAGRTGAPPARRRRAAPARSPRRRASARDAPPPAPRRRGTTCATITRERAWMPAWIWICHWSAHGLLARRDRLAAARPATRRAVSSSR